ncbi:hypothetical protein [Bacteroides ihuae]|uniref:hypothetical protein n=1 Tax=Bacteroides ihuae TaxID=1852362 RepID=UPI0008DB2CE9|nr:hypothetical protein [Bacteroides ihuae]
MKRMMIILFAIGITAMSSTSMAAMSTSRVRQETRFLTDKMAYELELNSAQYNDAYEINYDFIYSIRNTMDNVVRGQEWALNEYYYYLDIRNDDLRWVLDSEQYSRFMQTDYFYRPVYANTNGWAFRVYVTYSNHGLFYFGLPTHYTTYRGAHFRTHNNNVSFYRGRYNHTVYRDFHSVRDDKVYHNNRRSDFGRVSIRPNSNKRPDGRDKIYSTRPSNNTPSRNSNTRPSSPSNDRNSHGVKDGNSNNRREDNGGNIRRSNQDVKRDVDNRNKVRSTPSNNSRSNATPASSGSRRSATPARSSSSGETRSTTERSSSRSSNSSNARRNESTRGSSTSKPTSKERATKDKSSEKERSSSRIPPTR